VERIRATKIGPLTIVPQGGVLDMKLLIRKNHLPVTLYHAFTTLFIAVLVSAASAQVGGHIGFVLPLVTRSGGETTTISDNLTMAFPVGITLKGTGRLAFDMELVPGVQNNPRQVSFTLHPGLICDIRHGFAIGGRAAFVANSSTLGFTPLVAKSWPVKTEQGLVKAYFVEGDVPVRFDRPSTGPNSNAVTFALHFGVGF
jgi:hypothetical protein